MKDKLLELVRNEYSGEELIKTECAILLAYYGYINCVGKIDNSDNIPEDLNKAMKKFYQLPGCIVTKYKEENGIISKEVTELSDNDLSNNFQVYYNINVRLKFGIDLTYKQLNHYYRCVQEIEDNIFKLDALNVLLKCIPKSKYDYEVRIHNKDSIPAVVIKKSASNNLDIALILCKKDLHTFWNKEQIVFTGKRNYTISQLIEEVNKRNENNLHIDSVSDCFISATGSEGLFTSCEVDDENKCVIFTRK